MLNPTITGDRSQPMRHLPVFAATFVLFAACGAQADAERTAPADDGAAPAAAAAEASDPGPALLRMNAVAKSEPYLGQPACMVSFTVANLHDRPLALFSAPYTAKQVSTGKALTTATEFAGISVGVANTPLAPGEVSKPWKQNVLGADCADIDVQFEGKLLCTFPGRPCTEGEIETKQEGLAAVRGLRG
jgi:hypothetical protein